MLMPIHRHDAENNLHPVFRVETARVKPSTEYLYKDTPSIPIITFLSHHQHSHLPQQQSYKHSSTTHHLLFFKNTHPTIFKMLFNVAAIASLLAVANARIVGIAVPETIAPGSTIKATVLTENYIQSVYDVAIVFGYANGDGFPESLGTVLSSSYLGPGMSS